ncbi:DNA ligase 1-like [Neltuma alba]|uniref:DNA ligase 1-like n=1 Tax=Neltuma alba TaxID=207710 RepID=UPI0010A3371E|nr:DNA ligase 1-like [Prosopis alba]XP_028783492.1 DNA ligase 1-like [Prosopis alba]XP_028783493.1 DNA ligase 1-like [Prosopis alba]XP_028783494.1 DNA ligase 1-like [Prosopis alba]
MKTISGKPISAKPISLSKAAKILSKFISAENGASHVVSAYLRRASSSFSELNQLHKELKSPHSDRKHKRSRSKTRDDKGKFGVGEADHRPLAEAGDENEEKPTHGGLDFSQEPVEREKHKKKKKLEDERSKHVVDEVKLEEGSNKGNLGDNNGGLEEGKKHKKEKKKKKEKDVMNNFSDREGEVIKTEDEIASREDDRKEILSNGGVQNRDEDSVDQKDFLNKKKKRHMAGGEDKINTDEVKKLQKKRKNEDVVGRDDDKSGEPTKKKIKKKHGGDE